MKNKKGYTLVELIITLAVIGIMITPIFNAFIESNRVNLRSRRLISAAYLAQNELEAIKGLTRGEFNALDLNSGDSIKIDHDDWAYDVTFNNSSTTNGGTTFDVNVKIENVTDELEIALKTPAGSSMKTERKSHARVQLLSDSENIVIKTTDRIGTPYISSGLVDLVFNQYGTGHTQSELVVNGVTYSIVHTNSVDNTNVDPPWADTIYVNIVGYDSLSTDWIFNVTNNSKYTIDIKPFDDVNGKIKLVPGPSSRSDIYIGNALPLLSGSPSTSEEWYNVVITVTHNGTVYEVIESTVGK